METMLNVSLISSDPNVRSGRPVIAGTTIEVAAIAIAKIVHRQTPDEIASDYQLTLAQVYAALAYYYEHKSDFDEMMRANRAFVESFRANPPHVTD
jgi:uncharacterized protein (DUF433 family)